METHQGAILEKVVRNSNVSISELGRLLKTNRRTIYYWFNQKYLSKNVIARVGEALMHDFSNEFPDLNTSSARSVLEDNNIAEPFFHQPKNDIGFWREKYFHLLEQYNGLMLQKTG